MLYVVVVRVCVCVCVYVCRLREELSSRLYPVYQHVNN